ncbi:MAG TPA: DUF5985 family protein [Usitatibacter sp.]|jgi:hypothetical protein|nr:DUF5985 family protein [Usitatibacter sp.]
MNDVLVGGIATASLLIGLFFMRFWRTTHDRFFLLFALSFWLEGANRLILNHYVGPNEESPLYYLIRIVAYGLIIAAIVLKNRGRA